MSTKIVRGAVYSELSQWLYQTGDRWPKVELHFCEYSKVLTDPATPPPSAARRPGMTLRKSTLTEASRSADDLEASLRTPDQRRRSHRC